MQYLTPSIVRDLCTRADIVPNKRFGQNFMVDSGQVKKIVSAANVTQGDRILEVGPGLGSLTLGLLDAGAKVTAVEIDTGFAKLLPETVSKMAPEYADKLSVLEADALELNQTSFPEDFGVLSSNVSASNFKLVANLPYNVATPILITLLERFTNLESALVLVQEEVAERLCAEPGSKTYGIPSAKVAWFGSSTLSYTIPRSAFWPVPRVDSKLVAFTRHKTAPSWQKSSQDVLGTRFREDVFALVNLAFSARRKTLRSLLVADGYSSDKVTHALDSLQIDPLARGETLHISQFADLTRLL